MAPKLYRLAEGPLPEGDGLGDGDAESFCRFDDEGRDTECKGGVAELSVLINV